MSEPFDFEEMKVLHELAKLFPYNKINTPLHCCKSNIKRSGRKADQYFIFLSACCASLKKRTAKCKI